MAASVTANLTLLDDNNNSSNWSGTDGADAYNVHTMGTNSESWIISKNATETGTWNDGSAHDMSATNTHFRIWMKTDLSAYYTTVKVRLTSTTGNYREYEVANQTTKLWNGAWKCFVLDLTGGTETGTFDSSNVNDISVIVDNSASGNIRSVTNFWIDAMRYGTGITVTGTAFDLADIAAIDEAEANRYGSLETINDVIFGVGAIIVGSGATTTTFTSDNEVLVFKDLPYIKTGSNSFKFQGSGCVADVSALTIRASGSTAVARFVFDASDTNADVTINGMPTTRAGLVSFASTSDVQNATFNDCYQIDPSTGIFKYNTISNYTSTEGGALLWPSNDSNISNCTFLNNDDGVEYVAASDATPVFTDMTFDDVSGNYDVNNTSGSAVTIVISGTGNANSYNTGGSTVTFSNPKSFKFTLNPSITSYEWRMYSVTAIGSLAGATELDGEETATADNQTYNYNYASDTPMAVQIIAQPNNDYVEKVQYFTLKNENQDVTINLELDNNN